MARQTPKSLRHAASMFAVLALFVAPFVLAQFSWLPPPTISPPPPPGIVSPGQNTQLGTTGNRTPLSIEWSHPSIRNLFVPVWVRANYFLVCFEADVGASTPRCTVGNADWTESMASPSAALQTTYQRAVFEPGRFLGSLEIDRPMRISVAACRSLNDLACSYASITTYYSSLNAIAVGAGDAPQSTDNHWVIDVRARNSGTSPLPAFNGRVTYFEALGVGSPGRTCRIDIDAADVRNDPNVFMFAENGTALSMVDLPRDASGTYVGPPPIGMWRNGTTADARDFRTSNNPSIAAVSSPGMQTTTVGVATVTFPVAVNNLMSTYIVVSRLDSDNQMREFNEADNARAQCKRR
ncbi:MAG: hypothetical protein R3F58_01490 [Steroidobacteraceae bacterium]